MERPKGTKAERERPSERSRGVGEWPRDRERSTTPGPKESEATLRNAAARQGRVQRGRSEPSVAGMDRGGSESWARNGRAKGARGAKGEGQGEKEREGSKGTAGEQPDRPSTSQSSVLRRGCEIATDDSLGVVIRDDAW